VKLPSQIETTPIDAGVGPGDGGGGGGA